MAKIKKENLDFMSSDQIRDFYTTEDFKDYNLSPIKEYIEEGGTDYTRGNRINRVENILNLIVVERFINNTL